MARRLYIILIIISLGLGFYLYSIIETHSKIFLIIIAGIIFSFFSMGIHGLIAHSTNPKTKEGGVLLYPLLMGALWAFLFFLFVFFILPVFCPDFLIQM